MPINGPRDAVQSLSTKVNDASHVWNDFQFIFHFYNGGGKTVTLEEIGHLEKVIEHSRSGNALRNEITGQWQSVYERYYYPRSYLCGCT